jgi:cyclopropane fatty-acyl-phospholipid synthase-like methyltransferase
MSLRSIVKQLPFVGPAAQRVFGLMAARRFTSSKDYWDRRYRSGGTSGAGSYGRLAHFKADTLNNFVEEHQVTSVVEFGCGDGAQLELARYPRYMGLDVSRRAIELCRERFAGDNTKSFGLIGTDDPGRHDLALSLDVIYHLVEDAVFEAHMAAVFDAARRFVVVYSSNAEQQIAQPHVRHRVFTDWTDKHRPEWQLLTKVPNAYPFDARDDDETSFADFYFFERR